MLVVGNISSLYTHHLRHKKQKNAVFLTKPLSPLPLHANACFVTNIMGVVLLVPLLPRVGKRRRPPLVPGCPPGGHRHMPRGGPPRCPGGPGGRKHEHPPVRLGAPTRQVMYFEDQFRFQGCRVGYGENNPEVLVGTRVGRVKCVVFGLSLFLPLTG